MIRNCYFPRRLRSDGPWTPAVSLVDILTISHPDTCHHGVFQSLACRPEVGGAASISATTARTVARAAVTIATATMQRSSMTRVASRTSRECHVASRTKCGVTVTTPKPGGAWENSLTRVTTADSRIRARSSRSQETASSAATTRRSCGTWAIPSPSCTTPLIGTRWQIRCRWDSNKTARWT